MPVWRWMRFSWNLPLMPARRAGRHPDVGATEAARPTGGEHQRAAVGRQTGLLVSGRRIDPRPQIHGHGPGIVEAAPGRGPKVVPPGPTWAGRKEEDLPAVGAQRHALVGGC